MKRNTSLILVCLIGLFSCGVATILFGERRPARSGGSAGQEAATPITPEVRIRAELFPPALIDDINGDTQRDLLVLGQERSRQALAVYDGINGGLIWSREYERQYPRGAVRDIAGHMLIVTAGAQSEGWDLRTGERRWSITFPEPLLETGDGSRTFLAGEVIAYHLYSNLIVGLDRQSGERRWELQGRQAAVNAGSRTPRTSRGQQVGDYLCFPADEQAGRPGTRREVRQECYDLGNGETLKRVTFEVDSRDYTLWDGSDPQTTALSVATYAGEQVVLERIALADQQVLSRHALDLDPRGSLQGLTTVSNKQYTAVTDSGPLFLLQPSAPALAVEQPALRYVPLGFDAALLYAAVYPEQGQHPVRLSAIDAEHGRVRWTSEPLEIDGERRWQILPSRGIVVVRRDDADSTRRHIELLGSDGARRWQLTLTQARWAGSDAPQLLGSGQQLFVTTDQQILAVDPETGELLWAIGGS